MTATHASIFLSWSHRNKKHKDRLLELLEPRLQIQAGLKVDWWEDSHLRIGEDSRQAMIDQLDEADYVLQLLSPEFLASDFIRNVELPPVTSGRKGALPVGLSRFSLDGSLDLQGIDKRQIFLSDGKFFTEVVGHRREQFANDLAAKIRERILMPSPWRSL